MLRSGEGTDPQGMLKRSILAAVLAVALLPAAPAAAKPCTKTGGSSAPACFPKTFTGTFSGQDAEYEWSGTATLTRSVRQTIVLYGGRATVTWRLRDPDIGSGCVLTPDHGTFVKHMEVQMNRTPDPRRGWSYAFGGNPTGDTGQQWTDCGGDRRSNGHASISNVFPAGGFATSLTRLSGRDRGDRWSFHAR